MRDLPTGALLSRAGDLITVMLEHSKDGKIAFRSITQDMSQAERFTHVLEELVIRGLDYREPKIVEAMKAPQPNSPKVRRALSKVAKKHWSDPILVKFGERKYMADLFLKGKGRISLARTYNDPSLGYARHDDESRIGVYVHPMDAHRLMTIEELENGSRGVDVDVPYLGSLSVTVQAPGDFYVYCMAASCDVRMFDDFTTSTSDVDTCVVITRPEAFKTRLRQCIAGKLIGWQMVDTSIIYVDPFFARMHQVTPYVCKHFRFEYQKEFRLLWPSPNPGRHELLDHIDFEIGPLTDCAELIWL